MSLASLAAIVAFDIPLPARWRIAASDLRLQQALAFAIFGWSLLSASIMIVSGGAAATRMAKFTLSFIDLLVLATILVTATESGSIGVAQQSWFANAIFCVVALSALACSPRLIALVTMGAIALYLLLPTFQELLGMVGRPVGVPQQTVFLALVAAQSLCLIVLVGRNCVGAAEFESQSEHGGALSTCILLACALVLACVLTARLDTRVGIVAAVPAAIACRAIRCRARGLDRALSAACAACFGISAIAASLYTTAGGYLLADSLIRRLAVEIPGRFPRLFAPWVYWSMTFGVLFLLIDQIMRAVFANSAANRVEVSSDRAAEVG